MASNDRSRRLRVESLEARYVLTACSASAGPTNSEMPADVNADGEIGPLDALLVVNELNARVHSDPQTGAVSCFTTVDYFIDPNGDAHVSPLDALMVVNAIRAERELDLDIGSSYQEAVIRVQADASPFTPLDERLAIRGGTTKTLESARVEMSFTSGQFRMMPVDTSGTDISVKLGEDKSSLELTGTDSIDNYLRVLRGLTFTYTADAITPAVRSSLLRLNFTIDNGFATASAPAFVLVESPAR